MAIKHKVVTVSDPAKINHTIRKWERMGWKFVSTDTPRDGVFEVYFIKEE